MSALAFRELTAPHVLHYLLRHCPIPVRDVSLSICLVCIRAVLFYHIVRSYVTSTRLIVAPISPFLRAFPPRLSYHLSRNPHHSFPRVDRSTLVLGRVILKYLGEFPPAPLSLIVLVLTQLFSWAPSFGGRLYFRASLRRSV